MTQKSVELLIGKLVSDEELRNRFRLEPRSTLEALQREGLELSPLEVSALLSLGAEELEDLAGSLDPRLQKASLKPDPGEKE
jgi:hypothetical protein